MKNERSYFWLFALFLVVFLVVGFFAGVLKDKPNEDINDAYYKGFINGREFGCGEDLGVAYGSDYECHVDFDNPTITRCTLVEVDSYVLSYMEGDLK